MTSVVFDGSSQRLRLSPLDRRLGELATQLAQVNDHARMLAALHEVCKSLTATHDAGSAIAAMLRGTYEALRFSRALYVPRNARGDCAGIDVEYGGPREIVGDVRGFHTCGAAARVLRTPSTTAVGRNGELTAPLPDTRNWYVMAAVGHAHGTRGLLYVDGHINPAPLGWEAGLVGTLATIAGVTLEKADLLTRMQDLATRDPLTRLYNRRAFTERLHAEIETAKRHWRSLAYVMIDLDDLKVLNDAHGHVRGDEALCALALTLTRNSRPQDFVARYAGDEFVVVLVDVGETLAYALVERILIALRAAGLPCSIGAALLPSDAEGADGLIAAADKALYTTKARGKNGVTFYGKIKAAP